MSFKFVDPDKVPPPPAKNAPSRAQYYHDLLDKLPEDKVAVESVGNGQSARGIKVSVGRVASSKEMNVRTWDNAERDADNKIIKEASEVYIQRES